MIGAVYLELGQFADGLRELEAAVGADTATVRQEGLLGFAYAKTGNTRRALAAARALEAQVGRIPGAAGAAARVYLGLGDTTRALGLLERAVAEHDVLFSTESLAEHFFDPVRASARFVAVVERLGLSRTLAR
jgi:hypothetical protein